MFFNQLSVLTVFAITFTTTTVATSAATCYCKVSDTITSGCYGSIGAVPCNSARDNGFVQCCGNGDICGEDGFCHYTHPQKLGSGYYMGGCTDPEYKDSVCPLSCTTEDAPDVVYNSATQLWACCAGAEGSTNCSNPLSDTFQAPSPQILFAPTSASHSSTSTSTSTSSSSSSSTSTSSTSQSSLFSSSPLSTSSPSTAAISSSPSLSPGAAAGIGVGVAVVVIAIAAILVLACLRRRRGVPAVHTQQQQEDHVNSQNVYAKDTKIDSHWVNRDQKYEIPAGKNGMTFASELPGQGPSELPGSSQSKHAWNPVELAER